MLHPSYPQPKHALIDGSFVMRILFVAGLVLPLLGCTDNSVAARLHRRCVSACDRAMAVCLLRTCPDQCEITDDAVRCADLINAGYDCAERLSDADFCATTAGPCATQTNAVYACFSAGDAGSADGAP